MKKTFTMCVTFYALLVLSTPAHAGFIDFEDGYDGQVVYSSIPGLEFTNTAGYDWLYADWRTNGYNGKYPNYTIILVNPLETQYYSDGNFFAWLGTDQGRGIITFTQSYATYFQVGYSTYYDFTLTAFDETGNQLDEDSGTQNVGTGRLDTLRVEAAGMAYVEVYGTSNYWLIDNLDTDALQDCTTDEQCDDGDYCSGEETCYLYQCKDGEPVFCPDDNLFCNGDEACSSEAQDCVHSGNPCPPGETCDEETDSCGDDDDWHPGDDDVDATDDDTEQPVPGEDKPGWPEGEVTGGCCGG